MYALVAVTVHLHVYHDHTRCDPALTTQHCGMFVCKPGHLLLLYILIQAVWLQL